MKGSITKYTVSGSSRPRWRFRIYVGKDANGKKVYEGRAGFGKESEAAEAMRDQIVEFAKPPEPPTPEDVQLGEWIEAWIERYATERCTPKTIERYRQLGGYITLATDGEIAQLARTPLSALKHGQIEAAFFSLLRAPAKRRAQISHTSLRHIAGLLNVALNKAFKLDLIPINPMLRVELPSVQKPATRALTHGEVRALRDVCRGDWTFSLVELALATGARRGELLAATWRDVEWAAPALTISKSLEQTAAGVRVKAPKAGKTRVCLLPHTALATLQFQREQQNGSMEPNTKTAI